MNTKVLVFEDANKKVIVGRKKLISYMLGLVVCLLIFISLMEKNP